MTSHSGRPRIRFAKLNRPWHLTLCEFQFLNTKRPRRLFINFIIRDDADTRSSSWSGDRIWYWNEKRKRIGMDMWMGDGVRIPQLTIYCKPKGESDDFRLLIETNNWVFLIGPESKVGEEDEAPAAVKLWKRGDLCIFIIRHNKLQHI